MLSNLLSIDGWLKTFFSQLTEAIGFGGYLAIVLGVEALFIILFVVKSFYSYEARLKKSLDKANEWLFKYKKIEPNNIKMFNEVIKHGPKRFSYYWQQFILYRDGGPTAYMSEENLIEKPLRTSSWNSNVKNLSILTAVWAVIALTFGIASQLTLAWSFQAVATALVLPILVLILGTIAIIFIRGRRALNLDDIYHLYHLFARFISNACAELPPYIDFDLLFTPKEIEKGNAQLREYYEARARKAKEEFENAKNNDVKYVEYNFKNVGVDGALLLDRAMKESEEYINKKTSALGQIGQIEAQKEALRRNYENVQMDLQRKIQASKENIQKLVEQQTTTTSRIEVGILRQQQDKEVKKQEGFQKDYDAEELKYKTKKAELDQEIEKHSKVLVESLDKAEKGMAAEYQTFFEKVMKSAYSVAEKKVDAEKKEIIKERDKNEAELINVQTQIKRLLDENVTLRAKIEELIKENQLKEENQAQDNVGTTDNGTTDEGHYDEAGNFIYSDGSYHDTNGLFHDVDGKIYDMNGVLVSDEEEIKDEQAEKEAIVNEQINQFGAYISDENDEESIKPQIFKIIETEEEQAKNEQVESDKVEDEQDDKVENDVTENNQPEIDESNQSEVLERTENKIKQDPQEKQIVEVETKVDDNIAENAQSKQNESEVIPAKKRGRPRKKTKTVEKAPTKKRGRPRKEEKGKDSSQKTQDKTKTKKRGRPRKVTEQPKEEKKQKTRGRPKNSSAKATSNKETTSQRKIGRPRKKQDLTQNVDSLAKINQLISEEETKLNAMKALLNSELNQAMENDKNSEVDKERKQLIEAAETLKEQADNAKTDKSEEELSKINKRLEDLIKEISALNNKK